MSRADKIIARAESDTRLYSGKADMNYAYLSGALKGQIQGLCYELATFNAPPCAVCEQVATYTTDAGEYVIHFDFTPGEERTYDDPGCDPEVCINSVWANGMDVQGDLSESLLDLMTEHCLNDVQERIADSKTDAAIEAYEARQEERWTA